MNGMEKARKKKEAKGTNREKYGENGWEGREVFGGFFLSFRNISFLFSSFGQFVFLYLCTVNEKLRV